MFNALNMLQEWFDWDMQPAVSKKLSHVCVCVCMCRSQFSVVRVWVMMRFGIPDIGIVNTKKISKAAQDPFVMTGCLRKWTEAAKPNPTKPWEVCEGVKARGATACLCGKPWNEG